MQLPIGAHNIETRTPDNLRSRSEDDTTLRRKKK
ncbi:hypothetical protein AG0111_0g930 [Alternaria gaisen]|uniref:Uncharacterized protein n=1 Tax=Alternaria gaisen TaxID=167740 RepID=A0ACB6G191_9PLEO|nr:hypothetical protein AG0111_0g930 [Alternaria gaisen]